MNSDLQQALNLRTELVLPINNYIKDHQTSIEDLSEFCIKSSDSSCKAIEENINKYEEFFERIEDLQEEGYSLLSRYKQDSTVFEYIDQGSEHIEDSLENSCEVSLFSNPDEEEKKLSILNNPLLKNFNISKECFMRIPSLIRIIEEVLDKKFKSDSDALSKNRDPRSMAEYLISSLKLRYSMSFDKKINEIMHTFKENMAEPLIKFYCRMFQVFDTDPIPYKLSIYLIKMRYYYLNNFLNKQVIPQASLKKTEKMQIIEIFKTVRKLFNSDSKTGEVVLKLLKPEELSSTV